MGASSSHDDGSGGSGFFPASLHCNTSSPFGDLSFPICAMREPFYFDVICQCQEDFSFTCSLGQAVLASVL